VADNPLSSRGWRSAPRDLATEMLVARAGITPIAVFAMFFAEAAE
jgi:hypothetical protein